MALRYELATYDPATYLVGDEIVSGTPTFVHAETIYAICSDGYYHSFGPNKRVVKNGRYVDEDNIYADNGSGVLLDSPPLMVYQPSAGNILLESSDVSISPWTTNGTVITKDQIGLDGSSNSACRVTTVDTSNNVLQSITGGTVEDDFLVLRVWIKNNGGLGAQIQMWDRDGDGSVLTTLDVSSQINNTTYTPVTLTYTAAANTDRIYCYPCRSIADVDYFIGNVELFINVSLDDVNKIGPIFTTTQEEATDETINTYPSANWSNSEGPIYIVHDYKGIDENIILNDGVPILYVTSDVLYLDDGTNTTSTAYTVLGEHEIGIALDAAGGKMRLNVDDTWID